MSIAAVLLTGKVAPTLPRSRRPGSAAVPRERAVVDAVRAARYQELIVVVGDAAMASAFPDEATVLLDESEGGEAAALHAAFDWSARAGHEAVVVASLAAGPQRPDVVVERSAWTALQAAGRLPIVAARAGLASPALWRIDAEAWSAVPLEGDLTGILRVRPELVSELVVDLGPEGGGGVPDSAEHPPGGGEEWASTEDVEAVAALLGRPVAGRFSVVVRDRRGGPVVIRNAPLLEDGTPMPTRYWLVGRHEREIVGRLESSGGVDLAEQSIDPDELAAAHATYERERDAALPAGHPGPRPSGGVGGTRVGVKCLHAHLAWYLAGGSDPVGRWTAEHLAGDLDGSVAAVDCGTNSTRLLIADRNGVTLRREMTITRLGAGVDAERRLAPDAIERTFAALRRYRELMDESGVVAVRATATSAARDASNSEDFFDGATEILGARPELLSGTEEGRLSYRGATAGLDAREGPFLVCDLGGGSTELIAGGEDGEVTAVRSLDVGCVRVTERFLASDPPSKAELDAARAFLAAELAAALEADPELTQAREMVGVAGTVSTLVGLRIGLDHYDRDALHHQRLGRADVEALLAKLADTPLARRRALPGIEEGRADVIVGGALVLDEVMRALSFDELVYSEDDILDGLVASLLERFDTTR